MEDQDGTWFVAKSFDWHEGQGQILINKRQVKKRALQFHHTSEPVTWTSRYGSLTFNQHGRGFPLGGINEAGLAVEVLTGKFEGISQQDPRPAINELQWVQYVLDRFGTIADFQQSADQMRIEKVASDVHYFLCDATGSCATADYLTSDAATPFECMT